ncbi:MAG: hypothetical protein J4F41_07790 [Alphaproteobacteria bacterium]|nr:hypothetical protein [Alphaproteobacteria bacterium]
MKSSLSADHDKSLPSQAQPGFALVMVLFLSVIIITMIPMMLNFNRESVTNVQRDQSRALVSEYARQVFMTTHAQMLMNGGLPVGWSQGNDAALATTSAIEDLGNCSGFLDLTESWNKADARVSWMEIDNATSQLNDSKIIAGIYRTSYDSVPYEHYVVMGCVITAGRLSQGAVMRGEYAITGQQVVMLSLRSETS